MKRRSLSLSSMYSTSVDSTVAVPLKYIEFGGAGGGGDDDDDSVQNTPVILMHGLLGSKRNFSSIGTALSRQLKKKRRVFAVDLRNHGDNDASNWKSSMSYGDMADDLLHFLDLNGMEKAVLVAHSMGGKVAQAFSLLYPERVDGLVVLDIAPVRYDREKDGSWKAVSSIIDALTTLQLENSSKRDLDVALKEKGIEDPALRAFVLTNIEEDRSTHTLHWKIDISSIASQMHVLAGFDLNSDESLQYKGDTFFINGGTSRFVRSAHLPTIAAFFPNHMITTIRGAGHWVHAEAPDDTIALLKRYLDR